MKQLLSNLIGATVESQTAPAGKVLDFYFDDHQWILRYMVCRVDTPDGAKQVLVRSEAFLPKEWDLAVFPVNLTEEEVKTCPLAETDRPVSQQKAAELGPILPWPEAHGMASFSAILVNSEAPTPPPGDPHLRSFQVVRNYDVGNKSHILGHVKDFVIDDETWAIHALILKVGPWFRRRAVMVSPKWAQEIDWAAGVIWADTPADNWASAPAFSVRRRPRRLS